MRLKSIVDHELICHVEPLEAQDIQELLDLGIIREQQLLNEPSFWKVYSADAWKEEYKRFEERKARQDAARKRANAYIERKEFYIRKMMATFPGLEQDYNNAKKILEDIVLKGHAPVYVQVLGCQDLIEMVAAFSQQSSVQTQGEK
jgi:hypothetical protein